MSTTFSVEIVRYVFLCSFAGFLGWAVVLLQVLMAGTVHFFRKIYSVFAYSFSYANV